MLRIAPLLLATSLAVAACSSASSDPQVSAGGSTTPPAAASGGATTTGPVPVGSVAKVSANDASAAEITAALTAAGVPNADAWTDEVMEYRPYPADDPDLAKLREELAKYNPPAGLVDQIVSALTP